MFTVRKEVICMSDMTAMELFKAFNKEYKTELLSIGTVVHICPRIPFSNPRLNYLLYGGIPRGRIVEFSGPENGGKTTTSLDCVKNAQILFKQEYEDKINSLESLDKLNKSQIAELERLRQIGPQKVLWVDCENTFNDDWAVLLGVDVSTLAFMSPQSQSAEQIFEMIRQLVCTGEFGLIVIDSLAVMVSQQAQEKEIGDRTYGGISLALTRFSNEMSGLCAKYNCTLIGINQLRDNLNNMYVPTSTPGGRAWKHNCSVRYEVRKGDLLNSKHEKIKQSSDCADGNMVNIAVVKNKVCKSKRRNASYTLMYDTGIDSFYDMIEMAIQYDFIHQGGAWFTFVNPDSGEVFCDEDGEPIRVQGQKNIPEFLRQHEDICNIIKDCVDKKVYND